MGLHDLYEFDLVPREPNETISTEKWPTFQKLVLEFQPAKSAKLVGHPPTAVTVVSFGGTEVAPGLLAQLGDLAGTSLRVVPRTR